MKYLSNILVGTLIILTIIGCEEPPRENLQEFFGSFNDDNRIEINQNAGETNIFAYNGDLIFAEVSFDYAVSCYSPTFVEVDSTLLVDEEYFEDNCIGRSDFFFRVPTPFEIIFNSLSSDLSAKWGRGIYEFTSLSGDFTADSLSGIFDINSTSGSIYLNEIVIVKNSVLTSLSGNMEVSLAESPGDNLVMSGKSADITLNYNGNALEGYFEFTVKKNSGTITSPFPFDSEEEFMEDGSVYLKKSFSRGADTPRIIFETESGSLQLLLN